MLVHGPPHLGPSIRRQCLEPLGLTVAEAARGARCVTQQIVEAAEWSPSDCRSDGHPLIEGVRRKSGKLAAATTAMRPLAHTKAFEPHHCAEICG